MLEALLTEDDRRFRAEVRAFARDSVAPELRRRVADGAELSEQDRRMLAMRIWPPVK